MKDIDRGGVTAQNSGILFSPDGHKKTTIEDCWGVRRHTTLMVALR